MKRTHRSWETAIKHYHSSTSKLNVKYYAKVQKVWTKKNKDNAIIQNATLFLDENIIYKDSRNNDDQVAPSALGADVKENSLEMSKFKDSEREKLDNQIFLNAVLIENSSVYDREELKRYIKYKSSYLGKNVDMVLLFRDEFSNN